jgi:hypothetical protein
LRISTASSALLTWKRLLSAAEPRTLGTDTRRPWLMNSDMTVANGTYSRHNCRSSVSHICRMRTSR